ncbi:class I SAM-dependent methyltransferase [Microbacterium gorillae]|uniref:class I SAM-dependent methyltransferase n=1 Tax=Microbacterium gorillae TaxID=1231063 RepID=UPI0006933F4C|nr:class I SAM-dependent methyltransferase [Microbacterium gorillae]
MTQAGEAAGESDNGAVWSALSSDYERARAREDSLDTLVEWPAQRALLGDVVGRTILDLGCGNGGKLAELVAAGAGASVGIDVGADLVPARRGLELVQGDLNRFEDLPELTGRTFDRILFLQSFGYATDPVAVLRAARERLTDDGFILLTRTHPLRYARERAEQNGTSLGAEYYAGADFTYRAAWNDAMALTKRTYTIADLLNIFSAAGLWVDAADEPSMSAADAARFPHKKAWMDTYLGILIFRLRPVPGFEERAGQANA